MLNHDAYGCLVAPQLTSEQIKEFRVGLRMTQEEFSKAFDIPLGTVRRWEQAVNTPRASSKFIRILAEIFKRQQASSA